MPWMDLSLVLIIASFALNGLMQGLIRQTTSLAGFFLGVILASLFYRSFSSWLGRAVGSFSAPEPFAFVVILLGVWILANLFGFAAQRRSPNDSNWPVDVGGAFVGLISGVLVLAVLAAGTVALGLAVGDQIEASRLGGWLLHVATDVGDVLSPWVHVSWL